LEPKDVTTKDIFEFVRTNLPREHCRILDVGCGDGRLAEQLQQIGMEVVAVDSSETAVNEAKERGVDARVANFPYFSEEPFDAIVFAHSLHHLQPLSAVIDQAHSLLLPWGRLIVEDFAFHDAKPYVIEWFFHLLKLLDTLGSLEQAADSFGRELLNSADHFSTWRQHASDISSEADILAALKRDFKILEKRSGPYLYKYISQMLPATDAGTKTCADLFDLELCTGAIAEDLLIGRRIVAAHDVELDVCPHSKVT